MSLSNDFVIVDGLLTVEAILQPSYLVRRRVDDKSLKSPYVWVATIAQIQPEEFEVKGYLARNGFRMTGTERRAMKRIVTELGFTSGGYERVDDDGRGRASHKFEMGGKIAQISGE